MLSALPVNALPQARDLMAAPMKSAALHERIPSGAAEGGFAAAMQRERRATDRDAPPTGTVADRAAPAGAARPPGPTRPDQGAPRNDAGNPSESGDVRQESPPPTTDAGDPGAAAAQRGRPAPAGDKAWPAAPRAAQASPALSAAAAAVDAVDAVDAADSADSAAPVDPGPAGLANLAGSARWPGLTGIGQTRESAPPRRVGAEAAASATAPGIDDPVPDQALPTASLADPCADASAAAIAWPPATPVLPGQGTIGSLPGEPLPSGVTAAVATDSRVAGPGNPVLQLAAASLAAPGPAGARRVAGAEASGRSVPASIQAGAGQPDKPAGPSAPVGMAAGPIRADSQPLAPALQGSPQGAAFGTAAADSKPAAAPVLPLAAEAPSRHSNTQSMPPVGTETPAGAVQALQMSPQPVGVAPSPLTTEVQAPGDKAAEPLTAVTPVPSQAGTLSSTGLAGGAAVKALPEASISVPVHESGFGAALGAQVSLLARGGLHEARLQLNPAEMGPITVQIALEGATARVHFQADLLATREVIEASLPALASSLRESGLTLTGGGVSQQGPQADQQQSGRQAQSQAQGQAAASGRQAAGAGDDGLGPLAAARALTRSRGLVDLVA